MDGYGLDVESLPHRQKDAAEIGARYYFSGIACPSGHVAARYTKGGRCTICTQRDSAKARGAQFSGIGVRAVANQARLAAHKSDLRTYVPSRPCKHGHSLRWVASNNCAICDREIRARNRITVKYRRIRKEYGLSPKEYHSLVNRQGGACAICGASPESHFSLHIDHCHDTGRVRGLLCGKCNQAIGLLGHDVKRLAAAMEYISNV